MWPPPGHAPMHYPPPPSLGHPPPPARPLGYATFPHMPGMLAQPAPPPFPPTAPPSINFARPPAAYASHAPHMQSQGLPAPPPPLAMHWGPQMWPAQPPMPPWPAQHRPPPPPFHTAPYGAGGRGGGGGGRARRGRGRGGGAGGRAGGGYAHAAGPSTQHATLGVGVPPVERATRPADSRSSAELRCEPCDRSFGSVKDHAAHLSTHVRCPHCAFEGCRRAVNIHQQDAHGTGPGAARGLGGGAGARVGSVRADEAEDDGAERSEDEEECFVRQRAATGAIPTAPSCSPAETPEELAAYLAARKRFYPTAANVARKAQALAEAAARGELPKEHQRKRGRDAGAAEGGRGGGGKRGGPRRACPFFISPRGCRNGARCKFAHGDETPAALTPANAPPAVAPAAASAAPAAAPLGALAGLIAAYGESSRSSVAPDDGATLGVIESADNVPDETSDAANPLTHAAAAGGAAAGYADEPRSGEPVGCAATVRAASTADAGARASVGAALPDEHRKPAAASCDRIAARAAPHERAQQPARAESVRHSAPTLLQKLLAKEIRAEKSLVLQCIRHITSHDFLHVADRQ
ncbi:hypothetical protein KFE25_014075 [Diacronema lutheri]|uniref:C3H1-type domain-containing protein n=1 Tax=Diacronema lutheri TaxID=2081491 RepID=A0A8J5X028_DIALT|nr:hypothetical protein KFE25_014075 [Diacronema lutheri]